MFKLQSSMQTTQIFKLRSQQKYYSPFDNLGLLLSNNFTTIKKLLENEKLGKHFNVSGAATVSESMR